MESKKKDTIKIILLGDSAVGKTHLLEQYINNKVTRHIPITIGADFSNKEILIDNRVLTLQIWDI
jgi:Ras-related protein Rab-7A